MSTSLKKRETVAFSAFGAPLERRGSSLLFQHCKHLAKEEGTELKEGAGPFSAVSAPRSDRRS